MNGYKVFRAKFIYPVIRPPICDGAVVVKDGKILSVDKFSEIKKKFSAKVIDYGERAIMPALINVHTHLELSYLKKIPKPQKNFTQWLWQVVSEKQNIDQGKKTLSEKEAIDEIVSTGTGVLGDIRNTPPNYPSDKDIFILPFLEFLGFRKELAEQRWGVWRDCIRDFIQPALHAPYTVHPDYMKKVKDLARAYNKKVSIHVAESREEVEFLITARGPLREILISHDAWDDKFRPPKKSPVAYLDSLGILDRDTICVHAIEINDEDIEILRKRQISVCLCPRSNYYLGLNQAPWERLKKAGIILSLGTDSLASNEDLNLFREMAYLLENAPFSPTALIEMATLNGAIALGKMNMGMLAPGALARMIALPIYGGDIATSIIESGCKRQIEWVR